MTAFIDASVLVAACYSASPVHLRARQAVEAGGVTHAHCLAEAFNTLTGHPRIQARPADAAKALSSALAGLDVVHLTGVEVRAALADASAAGVQGGAIFDWLHMRAARKAKCAEICTYNVRHFARFAKAGERVSEP